MVEARGIGKRYHIGTRRGDHARLSFIPIRDAEGNPSSLVNADQPLSVEVGYTVMQRVRGARFHLFIHKSEGELAFVATDHQHQADLLEIGLYRSFFTIPGGILNRRRYVVATGSDVPGERHILPVAERISFTVSGVGNQSSLFPETWPGAVCPRIACKVERLSA